MSGLKGVRVLIVEDEFLVAIMLEQELQAHGCVTLGPYPTLAEARAATRREQFDLAILDVNLNGEMVYAVADELAERNIPFLFVSGYLATDLPARFRSAPRISKPHEPQRLISEIQRLVRR